LKRQNITISLPKDLLKKIKHIAIEREVSISGLLIQLLEELVKKEDSYAEAKLRHTALLEKGFDMGSHGQIKLQRDELHER